MNGYKKSLDQFQINLNYSPESFCSLTLQKVFLLGWLVSTKTGRTYPDIMRDCKLTIPQINEATPGLLEIELLLLP